MRAVRLHKIGEQFQVEQVPDPAPPPNGAVVRLEAAALNHRDEYIRTGLYAIPALMGAAVVVGASGSGTHNLAFPILGAAVCFLIRSRASTST